MAAITNGGITDNSITMETLLVTVSLSLFGQAASALEGAQFTKQSFNLICSGQQSRQVVCVEERGGKEEDGARGGRGEGAGVRKGEVGVAREVPADKCQFLPRPDSKTKAGLPPKHAIKS